MSENKSNRREFLTKLGLVIGAATLSTTGISKVSDTLMDKQEKITLSPEQAKFGEMYESWMEQFHQVVKYQKIDPMDVANNQKLVALAAEAEGWQKELQRYMNDANFVKFHKLVTEKVTEAI